MKKLLIKGTVIKSTGSFYNVLTAENEIYNCSVKGKFRLKTIKTTNPISVGDKVVIETTEDNNSGVINELLERKNYIIRKSTNLSKQSHIVASNIDQVLLIVTLKHPSTPIEFIDRFLITAEAYKIPAILVFNKMDIYSENEIITVNQLEKIYLEIGYQTIKTSVYEKKDMDNLKNILKDNINLVAGLSGVGKSTLINVCEPKLNLTTAAISDFHKAGVHTTTFTEMFVLSFGGFIIDTPGIRGFGLVDMKKSELYHFFPEIFKFSDKCKFYNCTHIHEPQCAVIEAVNANKIAYSRYKSYTNLYYDENEKYR